MNPTNGKWSTHFGIPFRGVMGPQSGSEGQETWTEDANIRGSFPGTIRSCDNGTTEHCGLTDSTHSRAEGETERQGRAASQARSRSSPGRRHVLWSGPGLRVGSEGSTLEPGAWQALFNSPAINNTVITLTVAITQH